MERLDLDFEVTLRPPVKWFASMMEQKLRLRDDRRGWALSNCGYLFSRLILEVKELQEALHLKEGEIYDGHLWQPTWGMDPARLPVLHHVVAECADIANYALMIADRLRADLKGGSRDYLLGSSPRDRRRPGNPPETDTAVRRDVPDTDEPTSGGKSGSSKS